jgi:catechol 2,3-dioxygenase-like lactoylglutathione lyase family enzyme
MRRARPRAGCTSPSWRPRAGTSTSSGASARRPATKATGNPVRGLSTGTTTTARSSSTAKRFYETIAPHAGIGLKHDAPDRAQFVGESASFSLVRGDPTANVHIAFPATSNETVDAFHAAALEAGYRDHGAPGERAVYHPGYYGAYVLDPDGNNIEVVNHNRSGSRTQ